MDEPGAKTIVYNVPLDYIVLHLAMFVK